MRYVAEVFRDVETGNPSEIGCQSAGDPDPRNRNLHVYAAWCEFRHETRGDAEGKQAGKIVSSLKLAGVWARKWACGT